MPKRSTTEFLSQDSGQSIPSDDRGIRNDGGDEMGDFEDAWEDEIESDEEVVRHGDSDSENGMEVDEVLPSIEESPEASTPLKVFIPGTHVLGGDEILAPDESAYIMLHSMDVNWSCLSFDVLKDSLGDQRQRYPATIYFVAGTQADVAKNNQVLVCKVTSLHRTQKNGDDSDSGSDDDDDEDGDNLDEDPILEFRSIPHLGSVNRVRAQAIPPSAPVPQYYHVASWAETGNVHIWDVRPLIESLDVQGYRFDKARVRTPVFTINSHGRAEGFAMDWASSGESNPSSLRLLTGDIHAKIYLTTTTTSGFTSQPQPFLSHTSSVEDLQWSPSEPTVFASCSADRSIQIWDVRSKGRRSVAGMDMAHESDVNVITWNKAASYLLLSGGDEGGIKVWDLRNVKKRGTSTPEPSPVASFTWHRAPITSIEWHPTEDSIFAASGADDQVTLWDLAVEQDDEETGMNKTQEGDRELPPQLMFLHLGQKEVKEVHWHPQIPGTVISTALSGFDFFKTISV